MIVALIVFACVLGSAVLGMALRVALPETHLSAESRDAIKLVMGLIATKTAFVLGLVTASPRVPTTPKMQRSSTLRLTSSLSIVLPRSETQRRVQAKALEMTSNILNARWRVLAAEGNPVPPPFLVILVAWLSLIFAIIGMSSFTSLFKPDSLSGSGHDV